ncbi:MAG: hypothetical protein NTZ81_04630, partial [Actinobacteria bacterium]|nr:hypothetical protein [Actinomycetota bacterium]
MLAAAGGICHVYLDRDANAEMAVSITINAKVQRPGVCNAAETLLVHADRTDLLQPVLSALRDAGVELRGDERTRAAIDFEINAATDADWDAEYLDLILAVRVVDDLDAALDHIDLHSTGHSEAIVTASLEAAVQPDSLFEVVSDLGTYPGWLDIVPRAEPVAADPGDVG